MKISYKNLVKYCKNYTEIENYELAKKDDFVGWVCHNKMELIKTGAVVDATRQDLIDLDIYYDRSADELIFLTREEHAKLHNRGRKQSENVREAVSKAQKGEKNPNFGLHWYTNGVINKIAKECPEGFKPGRVFN